MHGAAASFPRMENPLSVQTPLARAVRECEKRVGSYLQGESAAPEAAFRNTLAFALALMRVAAEQPQPPQTVDLALVRDAAYDAAAACRSHGLDDDVLAAAAAFERVAVLCDRLLP